MNEFRDSRGGAPTRAGDAFTIERRPAACPSCGGESYEARYAPRVPLSPSTRTRLEGERPYVAQLCDKCISERREAEERKARDVRLAAALSALNVPALYADVSLDSFELPTGEGRDELAYALTFARNYVATWPRVPLISVFAGGCGTGKGHLAWSIAKCIAGSHGASVLVVVLSDTIRDLREAWKSEGGPTEAQRLGRYRAADLLIIDEVSRHAFFGQPQQHLYDLVAWREVRMRPTILTTNETGSDLAEVLGPALSSRAAGSDAFISFGSRDWRLANKGRRLVVA